MSKAVTAPTKTQLRFVLRCFEDLLFEERLHDDSMRHGHGRALTIAAKAIENLLDNGSLTLKKISLNHTLRNFT